MAIEKAIDEGGKGVEVRYWRLAGKRYEDFDSGTLVVFFHGYVSADKRAEEKRAASERATVSSFPPFTPSIRKDVHSIDVTITPYKRDMLSVDIYAAAMASGDLAGGGMA